MEKKEYLQIISERLGFTKIEIDLIIDQYLDLLVEKLVNNDKVTITNVGMFQKTYIKPKAMFSPIDGQTINTKGYYRFTFTSSKKLLKKLNDKKE